MRVTIKGAMKSVTIWFNGLLLAALPTFEMLAGAVPQLHEYLPDNVYKAVGLIAVGGNILLRFKTNQSLKEK